jgi:hypothetical protein
MGVEAGISRLPSAARQMWILAKIGPRRVSDFDLILTLVKIANRLCLQPYYEFCAASN